MINYLALSLAQKLGNQLKVDDDQVEIYAYSLGIVLAHIISFFFIFFIGFLLGTSLNILFFLLIYGIYRVIGGGAHLGTYGRCIITTILTIAGIGSISHYYYNPLLIKITFIFSTLFNFIVALQWAPAGTEKRPITNRVFKQKQKRRLLFLIPVFTFLAGVLYIKAYHSLAFSMLLGGLTCMFLISPWGYNFFRKIDYYLERR